MRGATITLALRTLVESACLSTSSFLLDDEELSCDASEISGGAQRREGSEGLENDSSLRILNAVKLSLMLTRTFVRCCNYSNNNNELESLGLDDFVVRLQRLPNDREEDRERLRDARLKLLKISSVDQLNAINSVEGSRWILLGMDVKPFEKQKMQPSNNKTIATLMPSLGKLLHTVFRQDDAMTTEPQYLNGEGRGGAEIMGRASKRGSARKSSLERFVELGYPISICALLTDLIEGWENKNSTITFDDVIHELKQFIAQPRIFLHDPGREFYTSTIQFGQRYYGRSKELAKLLDVTTVPKEENVGLEVIFVSGRAGSGKSHLVSAVANFVSSFGFIVQTAKFNQGMEYKSRDILSALIDDMVTNLAEMKGSENEVDIDYSCRVARTISDALDADSLSTLADFVPSIQLLIPKATKKENLSCTYWQLVFLLSRLLCSVLSQERKIFIALDDLQWSDPTTLTLMSEVLISISQYPEERRHLVFVGMYRDDDVSSDLVSFLASFANNANVTEVNLSTLSLEDVTEMIMSELRLPRRLVSGLADVVHKRTHGHALFVVQLLNALIADSTIAYSPMLHRFHWDQDTICSLKTADSVASLIVSTLTSLPAEELQCLRIIACFGIQVQSVLLELLEVFRLTPQGGLKPYLCSLSSQGIIEIVATIVVFTHDLIQEQVYKGIPAKERRQLHCDIAIFLSSKTSLDASCENKPIDAAIDQLYLSDVSDNEESYIDASSLVSIATSQINNAGPEFFSDRKQHMRFASWNVRAGKEAAEHSSFRAALYYYKNGIAFLGNELWHESTYELCLKLHEGVAFSSSALGESSQISFYTTNIITNANFEDSIVAEYLLIGSLSVNGQYKEAIARGLAVLRKLKFQIPASPSPMVVMQAMEQTEKEASGYSFNQIAGYQRHDDSKTRSIMKLVDAISAALYHVASPFGPLVACATVRYSLQNGICEESVSAFVIFAYFQVFLKQSFESGRQWGDFAKAMLENASESPVTTRARFLLFAFVNFWYVPLRESSNHMKNIHCLSLKLGEMESAYLAQSMRLRFLFFCSEQLSALSREIEANLQLMTRFSIGSAKLCALDKEMVDSLRGDKSSNPYVTFNWKICNRDFLLVDAQSKMHFQIVEAVHLQNFFMSFWMGNYAEAVKASDAAVSLPSSKMPKVQLVYHTWYRGIVAFHHYRDGKGEKWLVEGNKMQEQLEKWVTNSNAIFENKLILLEAEHYASVCHVVAAKESYELSIRVARDNGYVHEQGLAYECMGKYLMSIIEIPQAKRCFLSAHKCYVQWGAMAKANKLWNDWDLDSNTESIENCTSKHKLDE